MILCCTSFTEKGGMMAERINRALPTLHLWKRQESQPLKDFAGTAFRYHLPLLFIGAAGIAVRTIAPFVRDKLEDSAVLVMDERGQYVIPLLSGHAGGANDLAVVIAKGLGATPVITTASDAECVFACDVFARRNRLLIHHREGIQKVTQKLLREGRIRVCVQPDILLPKERVPDFIELVPYPDEDRNPCVPYENKNPYMTFEGKTTGSALASYPIQQDGTGTKEEDFQVDMLIATKERLADHAALFLTPKTLFLGMGCRKGTCFEDLYAFEQDTLTRAGMNLSGASKKDVLPRLGKASSSVSAKNPWFRPDMLPATIASQIAAIASIDRKQDEAGLEILCQYQHVPYLLFSSEELQAVPGTFHESSFVAQTVGVSNVCERAAMLAAGEGAHLVIAKTTGKGMTLAAALGRPAIRTWDTTPGRINL